MSSNRILTDTEINRDIMKKSFIIIMLLLAPLLANASVLNYQYYIKFVKDTSTSISADSCVRAINLHGEIQDACENIRVFNENFNYLSIISDRVKFGINTMAYVVGVTFEFGLTATVLKDFGIQIVAPLAVGSILTVEAGGTAYLAGLTKVFNPMYHVRQGNYKHIVRKLRVKLDKVGDSQIFMYKDLSNLEKAVEALIDL